VGLLYLLSAMICMCWLLICRPQVTELHRLRFFTKSIRIFSILEIIYGFIVLVVLTTVRKNVDRVSISLSLLVIVVSILSLAQLRVGQTSLNFQKSGTLLSSSRFLACILSCILCIQVVVSHPHIRNIFGGHNSIASLSNGAVEATRFIDRQSACVAGNSRHSKCVLFMTTNRWLPFERVPLSDVRELYTFWSAFSPLWQDSIRATGSPSGSLLLCSPKGYFLGSKSEATAVQLYVFKQTGVEISVLNLGQAVGATQIKNQDLYITAGPQSGGCSKYSKSDRI